MKKLHYGWVVCGVCLLMMFAVVGMTSSGFSVHQPYIIRVNGFTNTQSSTIIMLRSLSGIVALFLLDLILKKLGTKGTAIFGLLCATASFVIYGAAKSFPVYCIAALFAGVSNQTCGMVVLAIILNEWFASTKATAVAICSAGTGFASIIMAPLVTRIADHVSLRAAFYMEAAVVFAITLLAFFLLKSRPSDMGLEPYRDAQADVSAADRPVRSFREGVLTPRLRIVVLAAFFMIGAGTAVPSYQHSVLYSTNGQSSATIATILSCYGVLLIASKFLFGAVVDRIGGFRSNFIFVAVFLLGLILDCFAKSGNTPLAFIAVLLVGVGIPLSTLSMSVTARELDEPERFAKTTKNLQLAFVIGMLITSYLPGVIADAAGSYVPAFVMSFGCILLFGVLLQGSYLKVRSNARKRR